MLNTLMKIVTKEKSKAKVRKIKMLRARIVRDARPSEMAKANHTIFLHEVGNGVHLYI